MLTLRESHKSWGLGVFACIANDIEKEEAYMADNIAHMACMLGLGPGEGQYWITL